MKIFHPMLRSGCTSKVMGLNPCQRWAFCHVACGQSRVGRPTHRAHSAKWVTVPSLAYHPSVVHRRYYDPNSKGAYDHMLNLYHTVRPNEMVDFEESVHQEETFDEG